MPKKSPKKRAPKPDHPAVNAAKRAIRRATSHLTAASVFHAARVVETLAYGEDRGHWHLCAEHSERLGLTTGGAR